MVDHVTIFSEAGHPEFRGTDSYSEYFEFHNIDSRQFQGDILDDIKEQILLTTAKDIEEQKIVLLRKGNFHAVGLEGLSYNKKLFESLLSAKTSKEVKIALKKYKEKSKKEEFMSTLFSSLLTISTKKEKECAEKFKKFFFEMLYKLIDENNLKLFPLDIDTKTLDVILTEFEKGVGSTIAIFTNKNASVVPFLKTTLLKKPHILFANILTNKLQKDIEILERKIHLTDKNSLKTRNLESKLKKYKELLGKRDVFKIRLMCAFPGFKGILQTRTNSFLKNTLMTLDYFHKKGIKSVRLAVCCGKGHVFDISQGILRRKISGLKTLLEKEGIDVNVKEI